WGTEDDSCVHVHYAPALTPFDALGVLQTRRGPPPRFGMSTPTALALWVIPCTVGVQQSVPICRQLIAGKQGHGVVRDMGDTREQHSRTSLIPFANHAGQDQAPDWSKGAPPPGVPIGVTIELGARQMRLFGLHETPQLVQLACTHMQSAPEVQHDGATVAGNPMQPGPDRLLVPLDNAGGRAQRIAFRPR